MDWMAHIAFAFILCALLALRWPVFGGRNTVLVMIGAVLPDIFKVVTCRCRCWAFMRKIL